MQPVPLAGSGPVLADLWQLHRAGTSGRQSAGFSVLGLIDHTHAAAAELLDDAVVRDGLADHLRECYGVRSGKSMYGLTARMPERKFAEIWTSESNP